MLDAVASNFAAPVRPTVPKATAALICVQRVIGYFLSPDSSIRESHSGSTASLPLSRRRPLHRNQHFAASRAFDSALPSCQYSSSMHLRCHRPRSEISMEDSCLAFTSTSPRYCRLSSATMIGSRASATAPGKPLRSRQRRPIRVRVPKDDYPHCVSRDAMRSSISAPHSRLPSGTSGGELTTIQDQPVK